MEQIWNFPLYIIPLQGGFASVADNADAHGTQRLLVFSKRETAILFIASFELLSSPKPLNNERELGWLLRSLKQPVTGLLLDPNPRNPEASSGSSYLVEEVLANLRPDLSPWNYPIFVLATATGFVTIDGAAADGEYLSALAVFTDEERAEQYLTNSGETAELCALESMGDTVIFLRGLSNLIGAVALDPSIVDNHNTAKYAFSIDTLLNKYLVRED
ncbi:MAG TPA: hypothetical protein PKD64_13380 [Pirellulaceae bacterium]|nr:hypothetical protein [Pirellulaceae bacterium]HMO93179.1 hypothetical protein [Pirellulaceae bacterium]HMP69992.1 hypothetical protein [Pirellulaceae bacterium]